MKFLHTADIHLDSPLTGLSATSLSATGLGATSLGATSLGGAADCPVDRLRQSTRRALVNLVDYALAEAVAFVVIAGDLYDGTWRDYTTGLYFARQMARLAEADIPVHVVLGNHDAQSRLTRQLRLPDNVHVFPADRATTVFSPDRSVALHGQSFSQAAVSDNLAIAYPPAVSGCFNIGLLHTAAGGRAQHANYAPCALPDLLAKGYDYWALGHVHAREILHEHPHVVFPGNLQGRHIRETGAKGFTVVSVEDGRVKAADPVAADVVRWLRCRVDLTAADDFDAVIDAVDAALAAARDDADDRLAVVRLVLEGATPAHAALMMQRERLGADCHGAAVRVSGDMWIEKIVVRTRPHYDPDAAAARPDAIGALIRATAAFAADEAARAALAGELNELVRQLPDELRAAWTEPSSRIAGTAGGAQLADERLDAILADARDLLTARILNAEGNA